MTTGFINNNLARLVLLFACLSATSNLSAETPFPTLRGGYLAQTRSGRLDRGGLLTTLNVNVSDTLVSKAILEAFAQANNIKGQLNSRGRLRAFRPQIEIYVYYYERGTWQVLGTDVIDLLGSDVVKVAHYEKDQFLSIRIPWRKGLDKLEPGNWLYVVTRAGNNWRSVEDWHGNYCGYN